MIDPQLRRHAIGASEIAAVMGWDPRLTTIGLWLRKMGMGGEAQSTYRMRRGKQLERLLVQVEYPRITGREAIYWDQSEYDPERPYMVVTADGLCKGDARGVEAKVVSWDQRDLWSNGPPPHVYLQCAWSMLFYGFERWDVIAAIGDGDPEVETLYRDQELIEVIEARALEFYAQYLVSEVQPPIDGSAITAVWLQRKFPRHRRPDVRMATDDEIRLLEDYAELRRDQGVLKARRNLIENQLRDAVGEQEGISWDRGRFLWRKTRDRVEWDWESMAKGLLNQFIKEPDQRETLMGVYERPKPGMRKIRFEHKNLAMDDEAEAAA